MKSCVILPAPAKINLFLHITGQRSDGYHELQTLFQFLDYGDELIFSRHDRLELVCDIPGLESDDNLIMKAARLLQEKTGCTEGVRIQLNKLLPMGGGLGGGSSDAATTLIGLNHLWQLGLDEDELAELGLQLGADVPVFVRGRAAFAEGVGEILTPVEPRENWYLILMPDCHVNTAKMFGHEDLTRDTPIITVCAALDTLYGSDNPDSDSSGSHSSGSYKQCRNDFEPLVRRLYPEVDKWLTLLDNAENSSAGQAAMSGSGACVFAPYISREQAEATKALIGSDVNGFVARGVNRSPLQDRLSRLARYAENARI